MYRRASVVLFHDTKPESKNSPNHPLNLGDLAETAESRPHGGRSRGPGSRVSIDWLARAAALGCPGPLTRRYKHHQPWSSCRTCSSAENALVKTPTNKRSSGQEHGDIRVIHVAHEVGDFGHTQMPTAERRTVSGTWLARALCVVDQIHSLLPQNARRGDQMSANVIDQAGR